MAPAHPYRSQLEAARAAPREIMGGQNLVPRLERDYADEVSTDDERRLHPRESIELVVRYQRMNTFFADYAKNISRGGTFVATSEPLPPDTEFVFSLGVPELEEPIQLRAKVMWTTAPEAATKAHPAGMGIQFQYRDAEERRRTEGLIERLIVDQLGQHHADRILGRAAKPSDER